MFRAPRSKFAVSRSRSFLAEASISYHRRDSSLAPSLPFLQLPLGLHHTHFSEFYLLISQSIHLPILFPLSWILLRKKRLGEYRKTVYMYRSLPISFLWTLASKHILCLNCLESMCTTNSPIQATLLSVLDPEVSKLAFQPWLPPCSRTLFSRMFLLMYSSNLQPLVLLCSSP